MHRKLEDHSYDEGGGMQDASERYNQELIHLILYTHKYIYTKFDKKSYQEQIEDESVACCPLN